MSTSLELVTIFLLVSIQNPKSGLQTDSPAQCTVHTSMYTTYSTAQCTVHSMYTTYSTDKLTFPSKALFWEVYLCSYLCI